MRKNHKRFARIFDLRTQRGRIAVGAIGVAVIALGIAAVLIGQTIATAGTYAISYVANAPSGCTVSGMPSNTTAASGTTVAVSSAAPSCSGWSFEGWEITTDGVTKFNDSYFKMPESAVSLKATWGKATLAKVQKGSEYGYSVTLYDPYGYATSTSGFGKYAPGSAVFVSVDSDEAGFWLERDGVMVSYCVLDIDSDTFFASYSFAMPDSNVTMELGVEQDSNNITCAL